MQKKTIGRDIKSVVLKFPNYQTISLRMINEKHGYAASVKYIVADTQALFGRNSDFEIKRNHENQFLCALCL